MENVATNQPKTCNKVFFCITDKNWSVSCSYDVKTADNKGGSENNIKYDMEFLDGVFTHLALVNNPRYERANIVFNSKTFNIDNFNPNHGKDGKFCSGNYAEYIKIIQTDKFKKLDDNLKNTIEFIFCTPPVYEITGNEFPKNGEDLNTRVFNYYKEKYNNVINVDNFGEVILDDRSIKDSAYHGLSDNKVNAFAAVPDVLKKGKHFNTQVDYKGKKEDRYVFVAPVTVKGEDYYCEVVVKNTDKTGNQNGKQRFYLHEVELTNKLADVFAAPQGGTSTSSKSIITDKINKFNPNVNEHEVNNSYDFAEVSLDTFCEALAEVILETRN